MQSTLINRINRLPVLKNLDSLNKTASVHLVQRRRGLAAEAERALRQVTQRLGEALPEEDAPEDAWLGAVDRLTGLRDWGRSMLCRLRWLIRATLLEES